VKVDAIEYFRQRLREVEEDILRVQRKEYRILGTAFVTVSDNLTPKEAIKIFKYFIKAHPNIKKELEVHNWLMEPAAIPSNIDWKNLAYDRFHRMSRVVIIALSLLLLGFMLVYPFTFLL
jgi:hypothetical protein